MNFHKQIQFSKHIKTDGRLREFNFLKLNNAEHPTYRVDVGDERGRRFIFLLTDDGKQWKISGDDLPKWIIETEDALQKTIHAEQPGAN